ncbi:Hypothetical protein RG1141_CH32400 [Neorhizobium galegae bv. officinalis bv. officinalis str. HAMBI 1141]|uniref:Uncharacterized protein n=1 Tax=Neorhizobium galegae bv. officinalis bv. officinalis str. HAMBI 1141 TaxID=1028801 RepID=A0A068TDY2_NEOGA|nr:MULTISPECIES: hypothetical protein [Neorhizobium]MCJ9669217.1 hypothetical protein [Neorhizobium sp. SHOUNA12B]MCJ9742919.1 hypothetical protein [Neorhizobium sp. SHOUNA12A]MCJ9750876.1 hypothetical protein [Neorhizobium sp. BETTINA12A]CDN55575.1 Hypothetical protein RG1141_CH32400 [Neorhizobium galegae bv. officinalis bv. officinalis str. HAMBI 1141]
MRHFLKMLRNRLTGTQQKKTFAVAHPEELQVVVPEAVVLPLPKSPREEISVPASINGRDLSTGRL